jgi:FixJ family two-component response regulator
VVKDHNNNLIAIVDDDESVQSALQDLLEAVGLSTRCFGSGEEFLESGEYRRAAVLVADICMPGMSGLELQAKLNAKQSRLPIVFITANGDEKMRLDAMRAGAVDFLTKPFDQDVLLDCIRAALVT